MGARKTVAVASNSGGSWPVRGNGTKVAQRVLIPDWGRAVPSDWRWMSLRDACKGVVDCPHSTPKVVAGAHFLMARTQDVLDGVFRAEQAATVTEETYVERTRQAEPVVGDLLYSREGTYFGIAAEVPSGVKVCLGQRMVLLRPAGASVDTRFLRLWLNSPQMQRHVHGYRDGSVAERLNLPTIRGLPVALPPLAEQRRIAAILGALDDKIELNRRMSRTLEEMALARTERLPARLGRGRRGMPRSVAAVRPLERTS